MAKKKGEGVNESGDELAIKEAEAELGFALPKIDEKAFDDWAEIGAQYLYRAGPPGTNPGVETTRTGEERAHCGTLPIVGYVLDGVSRESEQYGDYNQIMILLTRECVGLKDGEHVLLKPGQVVIVTETSDLRVLMPFAKHETHTVEVKLKPLGYETIRGTNFQVRRWDRRINKKKVDRSTLPIPKLPTFPTLRAGELMQQGAVANGAGAAARRDDTADIPF